MDAKDIFFIYTKGDSLQRALVEHVEATLRGTNVSLWCYDDWNWSTRFRDPLRKVYKRQGIKIDPRRFFLREPNKFVHKAKRTDVDRDATKSILRDSIVIVVVEPENGDPSAGVDLELTLLKEIMDWESSFQRSLPVFLRFFIHGTDSKTFAGLPISWESSLDPGDTGGSFCDCVLTVCRAWLMHTLWLSSGDLGQRLLMVAGNNDPTITGMFKGWNDNLLSTVSSDVGRTSVARPQAEQSMSTPLSGNASREHEDDERIARGLAGLISDIDEDRLKFALMSAREIMGRYPREVTFRESYRTFSDSLRSMQVMLESRP